MSTDHTQEFPEEELAGEVTAIIPVEEESSCPVCGLLAVGGALLLGAVIGTAIGFLISSDSGESDDDS